MINCLYVGIGGFIGSVLRYIISQAEIKSFSPFPIKTLFINVVGSFLIGLITASVLKYNFFDEHITLLLKVGICGGFTTFSTFALETTDLIKSGNVTLALIYVILSVVLSILAVFGSQILIG